MAKIQKLIKEEIPVKDTITVRALTKFKGIANNTLFDVKAGDIFEMTKTEVYLLKHVVEVI